MDTIKSTNRLEVWLPVKPFQLNQSFGGNLPCVKDFGLSTQSIVMGSDNTTCPSGFVKLYEKLGYAKGHSGNDLGAGEQPVYASLEGVVQEIQLDPARGIGVGTISQNFYDLDSFGNHYVKVRYWHLKQVNVSMGQVLKIGDVVGISDNTGYSSGSHVHWEGKAVDFVNGQWQNTFQNNGFFGCIDLMPFCNNYFAENAQKVINIMEAEISLLTKIVALLKKLLGI